ncbi:hypothetical protein BX600DRAFT_510967 [Xylariales sp. PMI_506]|nr:hypothetical protein BX600DRAFT_510967 [Xylariales sp. PMI_506]
MADGAASIVALVTFAFQASVALHKTVRDLQSQDRKARALKDELVDLTAVLKSLLDTIDSNPTVDFEYLRLPLQSCTKACEGYGKVIARCTKYPSESRPSVRNWITQQYLQGDIVEFKDTLASYKGTISVALANANIRVSVVTSQVLEDYKDMIRDAKADLQERLERLEEKIERLSTEDAQSPDQNEFQRAILEEKESTQQGLRLCAELSAQIQRLEPTVKEHPEFSQHPSAHKIFRAGLSSAKHTIHTLVSQLEDHENSISQQVEKMQLVGSLPESPSTQLARLQETKESIRKCIEVVSAADKDLQTERRNVFEDITMDGGSYGLTVSTIGDLVTANGINIKQRSRYLGGQISDDSYQQTVAALTNLDLKHEAFVPETNQVPAAGPDNQGVGGQAWVHHGPGKSLASTKGAHSSTF